MENEHFEMHLISARKAKAETLLFEGEYGQFHFKIIRNFVCILTLSILLRTILFLPGKRIKKGNTQSYGI